MARELVIVGAGGFGREVAWLAAQTAEPYHVLGFLDDRTDLADAALGGIPWLGPVSEWPRFAKAVFALAIGNPRTRAKVVAGMHGGGQPRFATLVHRTALMGPACELAAGAMVCAGCILTTNISVGSHAILNIGCTVGHDVRIGTCATLAPQVAASGCVTVSDGVEVGTAASIRQGLTLGTGAMLGMGSVLTKDVPPNELFFGVPAKRIKSLPPFSLEPMQP